MTQRVAGEEGSWVLSENDTGMHEQGFQELCGPPMCVSSLAFILSLSEQPELGLYQVQGILLDTEYTKMTKEMVVVQLHNLCQVEWPNVLQFFKK